MSTSPRTLYQSLGGRDGRHDLHEGGAAASQAGDDLFSRSGEHVAKLKGKKAYNPQGRYVGTLTSGRLIYRSTDSAAISSPFVRMASVGRATASAAGSALWGDGPPIPD
jgi:hypothetical protein